MKTNTRRIWTSILLCSAMLLHIGAAWAQTPTITGFNPKRGGVGTTITITGTNFSTTPANNIVWFGAVKSPVLTATATTLTVKVPAGASYKPVSVTVGGLTAWTRENFLPTFAGTGTIDYNTLAEQIDFQLTYTWPYLPSKIEIVDFDLDGKPDVVTSGESTIIKFFRNTSTAGNISSASLSFYDLNLGAGKILIDFTFCDVDNDGKKDLVCAYSTSGAPPGYIRIYKNQSVSGAINASSFGAPIDRSITLYSNCGSGTPTLAGLLKTADLNLDGKEDLVFISNHDRGDCFDDLRSRIHIFTNGFSGVINTTTFSESPFNNISWLNRSMDISNINTDKKPDIAVLSSNGDTQFFRNNSSTGGAITFINDYGNGNVAYSVYLVDFDNDSKNDLFEQPRIQQNNTTGSVINEFATAFTVNSGGAFSSGFMDIDGNGSIDIAGTGNGILKLTPNIHTSGVLDATSFGAPTDFATYGGYPTIITGNDIDLDGKPDVIFTNSGGYLSVMHNQTPTTGAILTLGSITAGLGTTASIPVTASTTNGIEGFQFTIAYDQTKLSYQSCSNWDAGINSANVQITNNAGTGKLTFVYNNQAFSIANGPFFTINFNVIASSTGSTAVTWNDVPTPREFINSIPNIIDVTYNNGTVNIVNTLYSVSGVITYDNGAATPMGFISLDLLDNGGNVINTNTTNAAGQYSFSGLANGNYTVRPSTTKPWNGVTSLDITVYKKHIGNVPGFILTGLKLGSGDVNLSTTISSLDLTLIKQRIGAQINSFASGDWLFESGAITISNGNLTKNIKSICYGDGNGSNIPQ